MKKTLKIGVIALLLLVTTGITTAFLIQAQNVNVAAPTAVIGQSSNSSDVKLVQRKLKNWGYYGGAVDGIYGKNTRAAVIRFQKKNGLTADGIVGKKTLSALGISESMLSANKNSASGSYTNSDIQLLARLIYAEARGESYTGQVGVGAVVLNRVKSSSFPNTIAGVIYQPYAFTCVSDGQINYTPDKTAVRAAKDAMNGWDPTYGCLYYYNPKIATSSWIYSRPTVVTIGSHVFAS